MSLSIWRGSIGLNKDIADYELPPLAWSDGSNIQFREGKIWRRNGYSPIFGTPLASPYWINFTYTPTDAFWMYASLGGMYATDGATHTDITRAAGGGYSTTEDQLWNGGMLSGIPVLTNEFDTPQVWTPVALDQPLTPLPNWPANTFCRVIRPYKSFLVALAVTKGANFYAHLVKWSQPADPGALPSSWDETDPTKLTGEVEIVDELPGEIRDALGLRDILVIYKDNTIWGMQYVGGNAIFRFYPILTNCGILATSCVALAMNGMYHIFASADDLLLFDGQNTTSVLDGKWKKYVEDNLEPSQSNKAFVFSNPRLKETWFCFPTLGNIWPNVALVYNWTEQTISHLDLPPNFSFANIGALEAVSDEWDLDNAAWDTDTTLWDVTKFRPNFFEIVGCSPDGFIYKLDSGQKANTGDYTAFVERTGLSVFDQDRLTGNFKGDNNMRKLVTRLWLKASGSPLQVVVGGQETVGGPVTWNSPQSFDPATMKYLDILVNTPLIAIRFESSVPGQWVVEGYNLEISPLGNL